MANKKSKNSGKVSPAESGMHSLSPAHIRQFYYEVVAEFKKIVWPDRKVTLGLSGFVVLLTVVLSVYLGAVDFVLGKLVGLILR
jgi:preprotein translocase subunit SecE